MREFLESGIFQCLVLVRSQEVAPVRFDMFHMDSVVA